MNATSYKLNSIAVVDESAAIAKQVMQKEKQELQRLNLTITELQSNLRSLTIQQNALTKQLQNYKTYISPIRKLLPELLQTIFIECLPLMRNAVMSDREAPLLLGRICHHWRQIAYATPQLWASVHIIVSIDNHPKGRQPRPPSLEAISDWLSRSGALPLSISIHLPRCAALSPEVSTNMRIIRPYLDTLAKFKSRWRSLYLSLPFCDWTAALGQFSAVDLPLLESLYISGPMNFISDHSGDYVLQNLNPLARGNGILQAPRLRSLGVPFYGMEISWLAIRWVNLTSLAILGNDHPFRISDVRRMLSLCPNLITCTVSLMKSPLPPEERLSLDQIDLPNLQSISFIEDDKYAATPHLLECLYTPQLRHLYYEQKCASTWPPPVGPPPSIVDALLSFLKKLVIPLEELGLVLENIEDVDVVHLLQMTPGLKRLSLRHLVHSDNPLCHVPPDDPSAPYCFFQDDHLLSLTPPRLQKGEAEGASGSCGELEDTAQGLGEASSPTYACPNLEVFHCTGAIFSDAVLLDFLRSRCGPGSPEEGDNSTRLKKVSIMIHLPEGGQESEDTRNQIKQLQASNPSTLLDVTFLAWIDPPSRWRLPTSGLQPFSPYGGMQSFSPYGGMESFSPYDGVESFWQGW